MFILRYYWKGFVGPLILKQDNPWYIEWCCSGALLEH